VFLFMVFMFSPDIHIISVEQELMCSIRFQLFLIFLHFPDYIF
jgi:hypothetical protein